jgi:hypothetical protein
MKLRGQASQQFALPSYASFLGEWPHNSLADQFR